jgi:hypothetical protein
MTEIESIVEPYGVLDDDRWKSVSFVDILSFHSTIVAELQLTCQYPDFYYSYHQSDRLAFKLTVPFRLLIVIVQIKVHLFANMLEKCNSEYS